MRQRFTFRFWNSALYQEQEIVVVGSHYDDAKTGAWAVLAERVGLRDARHEWRLVSTQQEPTWVWSWAKQRAGAVALAWLLLLTPTAGLAQAQRVNGQETIGQFRSWPESAQLGYVLGMRTYAGMLGVRCDRPTTNAEAIAALKYDARFSPTDLLPMAMMALEIRDGCRIPEPGASR